MLLQRHYHMREYPYESWNELENEGIMGQRTHGAWWRTRSATTRAVAALTPMAVLLLPTMVIGADSAAAAPAAAYTASLIPTGAGISDWVAVDSATSTAYFAGITTDELTVIDTGNNTVSSTIPLAGSPAGVAVDPVTDTIAVTLASTTVSTSPAVEVINGANPSQTQTIPLPAGSLPAGIAVDSSTKTIYVAEENAAAVAAIAEGSSSVTTTVSTGSGTRPYQLAVDETHGNVWVADLNGYVHEINEASDAVTQTISLGSAVDSVAVNSATSTVYAATSGDGLAVVNETSGAVGSYVNNIGPASVAVDPNSGTVYASNGASPSGVTWIIDASTNSVVDTITRGGSQIAADSATGSAYAAPSGAQNNGVWVLTPSAANAWSPIIKSTSATFTAGTSDSFAILGTALPAATYSETGALPSGVTLSASGVLSGAPAIGSGGTYPITITASNGVAPDYSQAFTLTVDQPPAITSANQVTFTTGVAGSFTMTATGYPAPTFSWTGGLPSVIQLSSAGVLSGTPVAGDGGTWPILVKAASTTGTATQSFTLTIDEAPSFTSASEATFMIGVPGTFTVSAFGFPAPTYSETGPLPAGVSFGTNGVLSGTPADSASGSYPITMTATNSAGTATQAFTLNVSSPPAVGVEGSDGQLWAQAPGLAAGWQPLGGKIIAPPAVAATPAITGSQAAQPLFIATGTDKHLFIRSLTVGWQELGPATAECIGGPAAVITGTSTAGYTLTVACRGLDNALWENSATVPASGLPKFTSGWRRLGGTLSAEPAVAPVGGTLTFFVLGTNGEIFTRTVAAGYQGTPFNCLSGPAASSVAGNGTTWFACQGPNRGLWYASDSGSGWTPVQSPGGTLIGSPAVVADSTGILMFAEGTNHAVFQYAVLGNGWTSLGGDVVGGVGAADLS